jgi:hypothetical protein
MERRKKAWDGWDGSGTGLGTGRNPYKIGLGRVGRVKIGFVKHF